MKRSLIPTLILAALVTATVTRVSAEQPPRPGAKGTVFLPPHFYPKHREALGLSEEQVREMHRIAEGMRDSAEKPEGEMRERTNALQEAIARDQIEPENAMERFQAVLQAENEMKALQFRSGLAMRKLLTPEQTAKLDALTKQHGGESGDAHRAIRERLDEVRQEIRKRAGGGEPPREVVEKFQQIEQAARQGRLPEAKEQLEAMLRHLREEPGSRWSAERKRAEDSHRVGAEAEEQMRSIKQKLEHADNPEDRERLQQQLRRLSAAVERGRGSSKLSSAREERASRERDEAHEKRLRESDRSSQRAEGPELRERVQGTVQRLREAAETADPETLEKLLRTIEPAVREASRDGKPRE